MTSLAVPPCATTTQSIKAILLAGIAIAALPAATGEPPTTAAVPCDSPEARDQIDVTMATRLDKEIVKSASDTREYRHITLPNNLQVLLAHDSETEKSSAAMDVNVGHFSDPAEAPGLAHFCEHMLFLGTKKYPDEAEYNQFLNQVNVPRCATHSLPTSSLPVACCRLMADRGYFSTAG